MPDHIRELLHRNLQEVFGEGNAARRQAAIESLYTEDCVLYAPSGIFVGPEALDKVCCRSPRAPPAVRLHPPRRSPDPPQCRAAGVGIGVARRAAQLYRL